MKLNGCRFCDGPIVFQRLAHFTTSKPPTNILWYATFDIPIFGCGVTRVLENCERHNNLTSFFLTRATSVLLHWKVKQPNIAFTCNTPLSTFGLLPVLGANENLQWQWPRGIPSCDAHFCLENIKRPGAVRSIIYEFAIMCKPKTHLLENTQGKWTRGMRQHSCEAHFVWKKTSNLGAVGRITYKFTVTLNARRVLLEKTQGIWKGCCDTRLPWKKIRNLGGLAGVSCEFTVTLNARRTLPEKR